MLKLLTGPGHARRGPAASRARRWNSPAGPTHLNDETFRRRWESALVDAVDRMKKAMVVDPAACSFPSQPSLRFDEQNWRQDPTVQIPTPQGTMTVRDPTGKGSFAPKRGTPLEAVQSCSTT